MTVVKLDDRGRLLLEKEIREKYGDEFVVVKAPGEIVLLPVPKDPLKSLREEGKKLPKDMSVGDLKRKARELAVKEALGEAKGREKPRRKSQRK